eukprot:COSAG01_NODE_14814_length_1406_cov_30.213466_1_plen_197_part_00
MCEVYAIISLSHTPSPSTHTHFAPFTHTHIQSVSKYRSKVQTRVTEKGREAGEGEVAWRARRETCLTSRSPPRFLTLSIFHWFVHVCRLLSTQNVAEQCRATAKTHLTPAPQRQATGRRIRQLQATVMGLRKGAAPCSRRSHGGGGVSSRNPCLHTTRPSGRVSGGGSAKRIIGGQARKYGKEGKPVGGRATTITV